MVRLVEYMEAIMDLRLLENYHDIYENRDIKGIFELTMFGPTDGKIKSAAQSMYSKQQGLMYVCYEDEKPVGIIGLKQYNNDRLELLHLAVKTDSRGHGLGFEMIKKVLDYTRIPVMYMESTYKEMMYLKKLGFKVKDMIDSGLDQFICTFKDER